MTTAYTDEGLRAWVGRVADLNDPIDPASTLYALVMGAHVALGRELPSAVDLDKRFADARTHLERLGKERDELRARVKTLEAAVADFEDARHQRRLLGEALRSVLVAAGVILEDAGPTGPELLLCAEEFAKHEGRRRRLESTQDRGGIA